MDMKKEEVAVYLATLQSVFDICNTMPNVTVKKIREFIADEIEHVREQIRNNDHGRQN